MSRIPPLAAVLAAAAVPVLAAAPASAASTDLGGPLVKGVCLLSQPTVLETAKVGVAATQRLQQLTQQARAEISTARAPIDADLKQLQADAPKTPAADVEKRRQAIQARYQAVQNTADQRTREIEATRVKALGRIAQDAQPVIAAVYKAHGCGLLLEKAGVLGGNMGGDLTADVVKALDAKVSTITFDREVLPAAAK